MRSVGKRPISVLFPARFLWLAFCLSFALTASPSIGDARQSYTIAEGSNSCGPSWPPGNAEPITVSNRLILAIPLKYLRYEWVNCRKSPNEIEQRRARMPINPGAGFDFFFPDFGGYNLERFRKPFDIDEVKVAYVASVKNIEVNPSRPANSPSNQLKNMFRSLADPKKYRDMYGLRCYEGRIIKNRLYCYSAEAGNNHEGILLYVDTPPYGPGVVSPLILTNYFSARYGGIEVSWYTNVKHLPHWRQIDAQIWKFLAAWNVSTEENPRP